MNDNMVMITERRFGELIEAENMSAAYECDLKNSIEISERLEKERDELKAKYEDAAQKIDSLEGEVNELQEKLDLVKRRPHFGEIIEANDAIRRLKDAERCIDEIMLAVDDKEIKNDEDCVTKICKIVESYRKKKGCAK